MSDTSWQLQRGVISVVRTRSAETALTLARGIARTAVAGIEVTMTVPGAIEVIAMLAVGGISFVQAVLEPIPDARRVPSGEVTLAEVDDYLAAGAWAACIGPGLWRAEDVDVETSTQSPRLLTRRWPRLPRHLLSPGLPACARPSRLLRHRRRIGQHGPGHSGASPASTVGDRDCACGLVWTRRQGCQPQWAGP
jgi:hypothetical protein